MFTSILRDLHSNIQNTSFRSTDLRKGDKVLFCVCEGHSMKKGVLCEDVGSSKVVIVQVGEDVRAISVNDIYALVD